MNRIKKVLSRAILLAFIITNIFSSMPSLAAQASTPKKSQPVHTIKLDQKNKNQIIVKYKDDSKRDATKSKVKSNKKLKKLETKQSFKEMKTDILEVDAGTDITAVVNELKKDANVEYAQPNYLLEPNTTPEDARFPEQWGLLNNAQEIKFKEGRSGVDINALPAWDLTTGSETVVVGLLDTGVDISHEDLTDSIYVNPGEIADNGIDDDNNGYIDDVNGWDFVNVDNSLFDRSDLDFHGTHMAGIIAGQANTIGITGVAPNIKLLPLKFINGNSGYTSDAIQAIEYAMKMNIKIINCSFGGSDNNFALKDAMKNSGILFICAAGNRGGDVNTYPIYPACFDIPNVLSVASIDNNGVIEPLSGYGNKIQVAAPGVNILSTMPGNTYDYLSGTSCSTAHVTGVAALIKSLLPNASIADIAARIKNNVVECNTLQTKVTTKGRVDAYAALTNVKPLPDTYVDPNGNQPPIQPGDEGYTDDSWYSMDQLNKIKEQLHYGESGVSPATGNYSFTVTDLSVSAPGFQVNISRTYNSKSDKTSPMGKGWTFGFEGSLIGDERIKVTLPNGGIQTFKKESNGSYTPEDSRSVLVKKPDNTWELTTKDQYGYGFNDKGWLVWMKDRNGNVLSIDVDAIGKVQKITDTVGRQYNITYNASNLIEKITDPLSREVKYDYQNNLLVKVTDPTGMIMQYHYDSYSMIDEIRDNDNNLVQSLVYNHSAGDNQNKVTRATDAMGDTSVFTYDVIERKTTIKENNQREWDYWFDIDYYTIKTQDAESKFTYTEYYLTEGKNKFGDVKSQTDRNGNKTEYSIDTRGNVTKQINPDQSFKEYQYDDKNNLTLEKDEMGFATYYIYDDQKLKLLKKVQPINGTDIYTPGESEDSKFTITSYVYFTDSEAQQAGYKAKGLLKSSTDPEGNVTAYTYTLNGDIQSITDPENNTRTFEYNSIGWKTAEISPKLFRTEYQYDKNGQLEWLKQHNGAINRIDYDSTGRKSKEVSPKLYDPLADDLANHKYNANVGQRYLYYPNGRLQTLTDAENKTTSFTYDVYGNIQTETKPNGSIYLYEYDALNRLVKTSFKDHATAQVVVLKETSYAILSDGKTQITETQYLNDTEKAITVTLQDFAGRIVEQQFPDGTKIKKTYNPNGTLASFTSQNGSTTVYQYDKLNRLIDQWVPFEVANGNMLYAYAGYSYDKAGRKISEKNGIDKVALGTKAGNLIIKHLTYYKNGLLKSVYDDENRKTEYSYDTDGNKVKEDVTVSSGKIQTTEYTYNHLGKVTAQQLHVRLGDLDGNSFTNNQDTILTNAYTYDLNGNLETIKTPENVTTTFAYDKLNRQIGMSTPGQDEAGLPVDIASSTEWDWQSNPVKMIDANGNETRFEYNPRGFLIKTVNAENGITLYDYDRAGRKIKEVSPKNYVAGKTIDEMNRKEIVYDSMGRVKSNIDIYKDPVTSTWQTVYALSFKYDSLGNKVKELDALGYDSGAGATIDEKILSGYGTEYTYNLAGRVVTVADPVSQDRALSYSQKYEYDGIGRKISETNARGVITGYSYDQASNLVETYVKKAAGSNPVTLQRNTYDLVGRLLTQKDGNGNTTQFEYNAFNKVRKTIYPGDSTLPSNTVSNQYNKVGRVKKVSDSTGKISSYDYDNQGNVLDYTQNDITSSSRYDKNGNKRFYTDGNGYTTEYKYDGLNRKTDEIYTVQGVSKTTRYEYDGNGNLIKTIDWQNNPFTNVYDPLNRLVQKSDPYTVIQKLEYNRSNLQIKSYDALNNLTQFSYDKNNRLITTTDPVGNTTSQSYDDVGNVRTETDGRNLTTTFDYDELNRLVAVTNPKSETTRYTYDLNNNMLIQTDGNGHTTTYEYNVMNKPIRKIDHGGRLGMPGKYTYLNDKVESYLYNADGTLAKKTDRNGVITDNQYDVYGRLLSQSVDGDIVSYTYDNNDNQLTMTDSTGTTTYTYDEENRVLSKTVRLTSDVSYGIDYQYDREFDVSNGLTAEKSTDSKGNIVTKVYDKVGRLVQVIAGSDTTTYEYHADGSKKSVVYSSSGAREDYTYYANAKLKTLVNKVGSTEIESYIYQYDRAGNQIQKIDSKGVTDYTYDSLNRLETVKEPNNRLTAYTYDKAGNRLTDSVSLGSTTTVTVYAYNEQNRLIKTTSQTGSISHYVTYQYDNNGNMVSKSSSNVKPSNESLTEGYNLSKAGANTATDVSTYDYNSRNQLIKCIEAGTTSQYAYNGDGLRNQKVVNGEETDYFYEYDQVVFESDGTGNKQARNIYGTNLIARNVDNQILYYLYNGHADVTVLISSTGVIQATYYYDAFGNILEQTGEVKNSITYAGYQYDKETELYYLNARYYDSDTARFLSEDTFGGYMDDPLSLNLFTYCANNPIMYTDPTGHDYYYFDGVFYDENKPSEVATYKALYAAYERNRYTDSSGNVHIRNTDISSDTDLYSGFIYDNITIKEAGTVSVSGLNNVGTIKTGNNSNFTLYSTGTINSIITGNQSITQIYSGGLINNLTTGNNSTTQILNAGYIGNIKTGISSTTEIGNIGYISEILTGSHSTTRINNAGYIEEINPAQYIAAAEDSSLYINNAAYIGQIQSSTKGLAHINNTGYINQIVTGKKSTSNINSNGNQVGRVITSEQFEVENFLGYMTENDPVWMMAYGIYGHSYMDGSPFTEEERTKYLWGGFAGILSISGMGLYEGLYSTGGTYDDLLTTYDDGYYYYVVKANQPPVKAEWHHIASVESKKSGFTKAYKGIFDNAGMSMEDAANKVFLKGHSGAHTKIYKQYVLDYITDATQGLAGPTAKAALNKALSDLKQQLLDNPRMPYKGGIK